MGSLTDIYIHGGASTNGVCCNLAHLLGLHNEMDEELDLLPHQKTDIESMELGYCGWPANAFQRQEING